MNSKKFMTKEKNQVRDSKHRAIDGRGTVLATTAAAALLTLSIFAIGNVANPQKAMAACSFDPLDSCDVILPNGRLLPGDECPNCDVSIDVKGPGDPEPWIVNEIQLLN